MEATSSLMEHLIQRETDYWGTDPATEAQNLSSKLKVIQMVLDEAERRRVKDPFLKQLETLWHQIDDALSQWDFYHLRQQLQHSFPSANDHQDHETCHSSLWQNVGSFLLSFCCSPISSRSLTLKMKQLNEDVDSIDKEPLRPLLTSNNGVKDHCITTAFSQVFELGSQVRGKETLVDLLLSREGEEVVCLIGVEGIGKTTVAQLVFNDSNIDNAFEKRLWIFVPHLDPVRVAKSILQSFDDEVEMDGSKLTRLLRLVEEKIRGTKFFLVLDNVKIEKGNKGLGKILRACLNSGDPGSRILVTTRDERVASLVLATRVVDVAPLSDEDCWSLLRGTTLFRRSSEHDLERLENVGRQIAMKCGGIPLTTVNVGNLLRFRYSEEEWLNILASEDVWLSADVAREEESILIEKFLEAQTTSGERQGPTVSLIELLVNELKRLLLSQLLHSSQEEPFDPVMISPRIQGRPFDYEETGLDRINAFLIRFWEQILEVCQASPAQLLMCGADNMTSQMEFRMNESLRNTTTTSLYPSFLS